MFQFDLQSILTLKEKIEDQKKRELGSVLAYNQELLEKQQKLIAKRNETKKELSGNIDVLKIKTAQAYRVSVNRKIEEIQSEVNRLAVEIEKKQLELSEAVKEKKMLENLKERKREVYMYSEKKIEQQLNDELIGFRYGKREVV